MIHYKRLNTVLSNAPRRPVTSSELRWLDIAAKLAEESTHPLAKVGSLIVQKGRIISSGVNAIKTHPLQAKWNKNSCRIHAEISAIISAQRNSDFLPDKSLMVVSRLTKDGRSVCSYPCKYCWGAISHMGFKTILCYDHHDVASCVVMKD